MDCYCLYKVRQQYNIVLICNNDIITTNLLPNSIRALSSSCGDAPPSAIALLVFICNLCLIA